VEGSGFFPVIYSESHDLAGDLNGPANQRLPRRIDPGNPESYYARKRSMLAAAVVLTAPGTPMLFMGQELLETRQFGSGTPLDWTRADTRADVVRFYRDLVHLRRNLDGVSPGLTGPNLSWHVVRNDLPYKLLAFHRWGAGPDDQVMVIMNFTARAVPSYWIHSWPADGPWFANLNSDWIAYGADFSSFGSSMVNVTGGSGEVAVGPYSALVLSRKAHPELDADGDGLWNGWEEQYFGEPLGGLPSSDDDDDGANNLAEQAADTDPKDSISVLKFTGVTVTEAGITLTWTGGSKALQVIESSVQLSGPWTPVHTNEPPTAITNTIEMPYHESTSATYFRISIEP
jgi:1,4-alpha-glucan branching enzyme